MPNVWYVDFRAQRPTPTGLPLYTYRVTADEFGALRAALRRLRFETGAKIDDHEAGMLVLFVSEWFRRSYVGGPWKYENAFTELGAETPAYSVIENLFERGLKFWGRRAVVVDGRSRRLATVICEGGLPLQLVKRESAALRSYLRAVLEDIAHVDDATRPKTALLAAETHADRLPNSLNHDFVHVLVRDLVLEAWRLQHQLPDNRSVDPIAHLDKTDPDWRARFPVLLDDDTAIALVRQTVLDAQQARLRGAGELGFEVELVRLDDVRLVVQRRIPVGLYAAATVCRLLGITGEPPKRMTLFAHQAGQPPRMVAWATLSQSGDGARYRVEPAGRREVPTFGLESIRLGATTDDGRDVGPVVVTSSMLPDLPLVFEHVEGATPARLIGVGRTRTRRSPTVVLYSTRRFRAEPELQEVGLLDEADVVGCLLSGTATFFANDEDLRCTILTGGDDEASDPPLRLSGVMAPWQVDARPTFIGVPDFLTGGRALRPVPGHELFWKPRGRGRDWQPMSASCVGDIVVRHVRGGEILNEARLCVLPESVKLRSSPGATPELGTFVIEGLRAFRVSVAAPVEVLSTTKSAGQTSFALRVPDPTVAQMHVSLDFGEDRRASLAMPFPARGLRFVDERGQRLAPGATVSLDRLSGIRAEAFGYRVVDHVNVDAMLHAGALPMTVNRNRRFRLHDGADGAKALTLRTVRDQVEHLLALTRDLDARVTLRVEALGDTQAALLDVARYDVRVVPERERAVVRLSNAVVGGPPPSTQRVRVEARHLAALEQRPDLLPADATPPTEWRFEPAKRAAGPWLLTAWEGTRCVGRPLLWTVQAGEAASPMPRADSSLVQAVCLARQNERTNAIHAALTAMARTPASPDWQVLGAYLSTVGDLPAETFDIVTALVEHPETLVGALARQPRPLLRNIWLRLPDLLFIWETVPVSAWKKALSTFRDHLVTTWESIPDLQAVMSRDALLADSFAPVTALLDDADGLMDVHKEVLHEEFGAVFPRCEVLRLEAARTPEGQAQIRCLLDAAWSSTCSEHQNEHWETIVANGDDRPPEWLIAPLSGHRRYEKLWELVMVPRNLPWRRPVAFAPLVAALYPVEGHPPTPAVIECLKRLKAFAPFWFDAAYPNFLACALALADG